MQSRPKFKVSQAGVGEKTERCGWQLAKDGKEGREGGQGDSGREEDVGGLFNSIHSSLSRIMGIISISFSYPF